MNKWKLYPANRQVSKYVECYWFLEKQKDSQDIDHPKLYPDPSAHIILANSDSQYQYTQDYLCFNGVGSHCLYPHRNTFLLNHSKPFLILGIKLRIGALYSMKLMVYQSVLDSVVAINSGDVFGVKSVNVNKLLAKSLGAPEVIRDKLDDILEARLQIFLEDRHTELTRRVIPLLTSTPIRGLSDGLNCSQRTIERSFLKVTGITLKQCQSMLRFEQVLDHLHQVDEKEIDWLDIVSEFGFSDQSHLIRHLKNYISATPTEYAKQRDLTIDIYGNFETD